MYLGPLKEFNLILLITAMHVYMWHSCVDVWMCYREEGNRCLFLRVDIVLHGATYVVVFTDTDQMPPPYRVDNFAEVCFDFWET